MDSGVLIAGFTAVAAFIVVLAPFFIGKGGTLAAASAMQNREQLTQVKRALAKRYLRDEQAFKDKEISSRAWKARQEFLIRRFIDTARRLDYIDHVERARTEKES